MAAARTAKQTLLLLSYPKSYPTPILPEPMSYSYQPPKHTPAKTITESNPIFSSTFLVMMKGAGGVQRMKNEDENDEDDDDKNIF